MLYDFKGLSKKKGVKLPRIGIILLTFTFAFFLIFLTSKLKWPEVSTPSNFPQTQKEVLKHPKNPKAHFQLARVYQEKNDFENAKKEIMLALSLNPDYPEAENLLGQIQNIEEEPGKIKEEIKRWERILEERPGYRDIYFQTAILNWQIYQNQEALEAVNKALELDPNFEPAKDFKKLLLE